MSDRLRRAIQPPAHYEPKVNTLIAKSRREHALQRSQRHAPTLISTSFLTPLALSQQLRIYPQSRAAGPRPPRSWAYPALTSSAAGSSNRSTPGSVAPHPEWRARALRWILVHLDRPGLIPHAVEENESGRSSIPTLREMCLHNLLAADPIDDQIISPDLPAHIRRFIVRYTSIHSPLPWAALTELWGVAYGEQGADGELIFVGKGAGGSSIGSASIRDVLTPAEVDLQSEEGDHEDDLAWDAEEYTSPPPLNVLISLAHPLSKHLSFFPPTITHLALIATPLDPDTAPRAMMAKLSGILHLLEALDLSCNPWLVPNALTSVDWSKKWPRLRAVAFINCPNLADREATTNIINSKRSWEKSIRIDFA
ncbi:hypothetical protein FRC10_008231 [Ceratobasidium sp. 414]|nr:hypothetical protein FRC10_008231 [Ceratobasidium sp. 414]